MSLTHAGSDTETWFLPMRTTFPCLYCRPKKWDGPRRRRKKERQREQEGGNQTMRSFWRGCESMSSRYVLVMLGFDVPLLWPDKQDGGWRGETHINQRIQEGGRRGHLYHGNHFGLTKSHLRALVVIQLPTPSLVCSGPGMEASGWRRALYAT